MKEEALCWFAGLHQLPSGHTGGCGPSPWRLSSRLGVGDQEWSLKRPTPHAQPSTAPAAWPDQVSSMLSLHVGTRVSWIQLALSGASGTIHVWTADTVATQQGAVSASPTSTRPAASEMLSRPL